MASTILLKRSNTAGNDAYTGVLGEVTLDTQKRKLRIHDGVVVGGHEVANMQDIIDLAAVVDGLAIDDIAGLTAALNAINETLTGSGGHDERITDIENSYINKDGSVAFTGDLDMGANNVTNVAYPVNDTDAATKVYVDDEIAALGNVFSYEGSIDASADEQAPFDLTALQKRQAGAYYTITTEGYIDDGTGAVYVNANDSIVFDAQGSYKVIDNTNSEIQGTTNFISVSGNTDTGFTVDIATSFKNRVNAIEGDAVYGVLGTAPITVNNTDPQNPIIEIDAATQTSRGTMSASDKTKLDGIESGAQVNTVTSVNGYAGAVILNKADVGLGSVSNFATADQNEAVAATANNRFVTPLRVREFIEGGTYTVDGGTF